MQIYIIPKDDACNVFRDDTCRYISSRKTMRVTYVRPERRHTHHRLDPYMRGWAVASNIKTMLKYESQM